jgi:hypothetical protein
MSSLGSRSRCGRLQHLFPATTAPAARELDQVCVPCFGRFGAVWDDLMVIRWSANPLGMRCLELDAGSRASPRSEGWTVEFRPGFRSMAVPTREAHRLAEARPLPQPGDPLDGGERRGRPGLSRQPQAAKDKSTERIDGIVTMIMAIGRAMVDQEEQHVEYQLFWV